MKRLVQAPCAEIVTILQGPLGQVSPKPTGLLAIRAPHVRRINESFAIHGRVVQAAPQYRDDGSFGTSVLKEYPPRFSAVLLMSIWSSARDPNEYKDEYNQAVQILRDRCKDIEDETGSGPTPRTNIVPYPSMQFLGVWPEANASIGPDFNADATRRIREGARSSSSRQEALSIAKDFINSCPS